MEFWRLSFLEAIGNSTIEFVIFRIHYDGRRYRQRKNYINRTTGLLQLRWQSSCHVCAGISGNSVERSLRPTSLPRHGTSGTGHWTIQEDSGAKDFALNDIDSFSFQSFKPRTEMWFLDEIKTVNDELIMTLIFRRKLQLSLFSSIILPIMICARRILREEENKTSSACAGS